MKRFVRCSSVAAVIEKDNVDTDMIIRIERMTALKRGELGEWAFEMWRYQPDGSPDPDFVLNQPPFDTAEILIAGANFGCGSSREKAVWALDDYGIRCVIAESFGDIFYNNCLQNGLLPIRLPAEPRAALAAGAREGRVVHVDLEARTITVEGGASVAFQMPDQQREALLNGWDEVDQDLRRLEEIATFRERDARLRPWVYAVRPA